eukprot:COSAG04_NODE_93_length_26686_cov_10.174364_10_plen_112_part_00
MGNCMCPAPHEGEPPQPGNGGGKQPHKEKEKEKEPEKEEENERGTGSRPTWSFEGTIARDIREGGWIVPPSPSACRGHLQAAKLRLVLCFLHSNRLMGGRVPETIAANFKG